MRRIFFLSPIAAAVVVGLAGGPAAADSEVLLRRHAEFDNCHRTVATLLSRLQPRPDQVRSEVDTGAMLRIKLVSSDANLVFQCNKVAQTLEILRTTPGEAGLYSDT